MRIVVGITGGIAAYKAVGVVRGLVLAGHDVHVVPTEAALRFVGRPTLEAISRNEVHTRLDEGVAEVRHVALGQSADLIVIAPATAHTLAKLATGLADDLLGTTVLASTAPLVVAPAMHTEMWLHPATRANVDLLASRGVVFVGPDSGQLTGNDAGPGRMAEPERIVEEALGAVAPHGRSLAGRRVLVTAGGTREPLDPVRFLGNRSSGKQGVAIARAALALGAEVVLIAAHLEVPQPSGVRVIDVSTAADLERAVDAEAQSADIVVMAAAVADYRPTAVAAGKLKKDDSGDGLELVLERTPDVLAALGAGRIGGVRDGRVVVGFAAETEIDDAALAALAADKVRRKGCDFLVVNRVGWTEGFGADDTTVQIVDRAGRVVARHTGTKVSAAAAILEAVS